MKKAMAIVVIVSLALGALTLAGCTKVKSDTSAATKSNSTGALAGKTIIVGTDAPYPPMEMVKADGTYEGFDVDIMNAAAKAEGGTVQFKTSGFDALIAAMGATGGDYDAAASSITITPERQQNMLFSDPYFNANQSFAVPTGSAMTSTKDIKKGMKIAVQLGTTGEIWANKNLKAKGVEVKSYDQVPGCFAALSAGDVDGIIVDFQVASDYAADKTRKATIVEQISTGEQYGIAFPKANTAYLAAFNKGLKTIKADGTYTKIYKKWFKVEPVSIP